MGWIRRSRKKERERDDCTHGHLLTGTSHGKGTACLCLSLLLPPSSAKQETHPESKGKERECFSYDGCPHATHMMHIIYLSVNPSCCYV